MYVILGILTFFLILYMTLYYKINKKIILLLKVITSLSFLILGFFTFSKSNQNNYNYCTLMLVGLFCGFIGDIILGLRSIYYQRKNEYFILGLTMFFLGHIYYVIAFFEYTTNFYYLYFIVAIVFSLLLINFTKILKVNFGKSKLIDYGYIYISSLLLSLTIINMIDFPNFFSKINMVAAISFVTSDFILCFIYFKKMNYYNTRILKMFNIFLYYLGQTLFAISILYA